MFETKDSRLRRYLPRVLYVLVALVFVPIALRALDFLRHSLHWPLSICLDASILRFESWSLMQNVWPWRDIVSINLPVTHYIHVIGLSLFGADDYGFRLLDAAYIILLAVLTGLYLLRVSRLAAGIGFALVLTLPHEATPFGAFQREILMLPMWLGALWAAETLSARLRAPQGRGNPGRHPARPSLYILLGVLAVLAVAIKPTAGLFFACLALAILFTAFRTRTTADALALLARGLFFALLAVALTLVAVGLPLVLADASLPATLVQAWLHQTGAYTAVVETIPPIQLLRELFSFQPLHWALALNQPVNGPADTGHFSLLHLTLFALWFLFALKNGRSLLLGWFAAAALLQYVLQMRGFQYHLYPLWYAWVLATAIALADMMRAKETEGLKFAVLFFALSLLLQQYNSLRVYNGTGLYERGQPEKIPTYRTPNEIGKLAGAIRAFEERRAARRPDAERERLVDAAKNAPLYFQTFEHASIALGAAIPHNLRLASRYPVDYIVWEESKYRDQAREDMLAALRTNRPALLAYSAGNNDEQKNRVRGWPELRQWIRQDYRRVKIIKEPGGDEYWIFARRDYARLAN